MNVGASKPSDAGLYFQWGDTSGYTADQVGTGEGKFASDWSDYKWNPSGDGETFTKYTTTGAALDLEDDAAHVHMGGSWHMPTPTQIQELINETTGEWTTSDGGIIGRLFTSKTDTSKSIFIPAAGFAWGGSLRDVDYCGCVWSSMLSSSNVSDGQGLYFNLDVAYFGDGNRSGGGSVRGVLG